MSMSLEAAGECGEREGGRERERERARERERTLSTIGASQYFTVN